MDKLFGFKKGTETGQDYEKDELSFIWKIISGKRTYSSSRSKSGQIGSPVIRYLHKAIANTFFARKVTGTINEGELQFLDCALKELLNATRDDCKIKGDRSDAGLTAILIDQLMYYKDWATRMHNMGTRGELCVGGIITPILYACGVELKSEPVEPRWMDIQYLINVKFLAKNKEHGFYQYNFEDPSGKKQKLRLPKKRLTSIRLGNNIEFSPPPEQLTMPNSPNSFYVYSEDSTDDGSRHHEQAPTEEFTTTSQPQTLKEANTRIGLLEKLTQWQGKAIDALKSTVDTMSKQIKDLQDKVSCSSSRQARRVALPRAPSRVRRQQSRRSTNSRQDAEADSTSRHSDSIERTTSKRHSTSRQPDSIEPTAEDSNSTSGHPDQTHSAPSTLAYNLETMEASVDNFFSMK